MLVFGPYQACIQVIQQLMEQNVIVPASYYSPDDNRSNYHQQPMCPSKFDFVILNLTSMNQDPSIMKLAGLLIGGMQPGNPNNDPYYYNTIIQNELSLDHIMQIMYPLYEGKHVFVCIDTLESHTFPQMQNDMLMWFIKERYGYDTIYINNPEDFFSYNPDDCRFTTRGIMNFDQDKMKMLSIKEARRIESMQNSGKRMDGVFYGQSIV